MSAATVLIATADPWLHDALLRLAAAADIPAAAVRTAEAACAGWRTSGVVLVGADLAGPLAALCPARRSGVVLVAADLARPDPDLYRLAVEVGAQDVAVLPGWESWLVSLLATAGEPSQARGMVVCLIGGRGGAGTSVLAAILSLVGARLGHRTLLIDGDPVGGGLDLVLGLEKAPGPRWPAFAAVRGRLSATALSTLPGMGRNGSPHPLSVLSWTHAPSPTGPQASITPPSAPTTGPAPFASPRSHPATPHPPAQAPTPHPASFGPPSSALPTGPALSDSRAQAPTIRSTSFGTASSALPTGPADSPAQAATPRPASFGNPSSALPTGPALSDSPARTPITRSTPFGNRHGSHGPGSQFADAAPPRFPRPPSPPGAIPSVIHGWSALPAAQQTPSPQSCAAGISWAVAASVDSSPEGPSQPLAALHVQPAATQNTLVSAPSRSAPASSAVATLARAPETGQHRGVSWANSQEDRSFPQGLHEVSERDPCMRPGTGHSEAALSSTDPSRAGIATLVRRSETAKSQGVSWASHSAAPSSPQMAELATRSPQVPKTLRTNQNIVVPPQSRPDPERNTSPVMLKCDADLDSEPPSSSADSAVSPGISWARSRRDLDAAFNSPRPSTPARPSPGGTSVGPGSGSINLGPGPNTRESPHAAWASRAVPEGGSAAWAGAMSANAGAAEPLPESTSPADGINAAAAASVLDAAVRGFDLVVVDLPRWIGPIGVAALPLSDAAFLLVPAEVRATVAAGVVAEQVARHTSALRLIARGPAPGGLTADDMSTALRLPLAAELTQERRIQRALETGELPAAVKRGPTAALCERLLYDLGAGHLDARTAA